eukprot:19022_1
MSSSHLAIIETRNRRMQQPKARVTDIGSNLKYNIRSYKYNVKPSYDTQLQSNSIIFKQNKQRLMVGLSFYATNDCFDVEFSQLQQLIKQKSSKPDYLSSDGSGNNKKKV